MTIKEALGYSFSDRNLLNRALTRKAYALEQKQRNQECEDQEAFCVLGDAVLKTVAVDLLMKKSSCQTKEEITNKKKGIEREETLAQIAQNLRIGPFIKLGIGEEKQKANEEPRVLAETLEALIGAIYLDCGFNKSKEIVAKWFEPYFFT